MNRRQFCVALVALPLVPAMPATPVARSFPTADALALSYGCGRVTGQAIGWMVGPIIGGILDMPTAAS